MLPACRAVGCAHLSHSGSIIASIHAGISKKNEGNGDGKSRSIECKGLERIVILNIKMFFDIH